MNQPGDNVGGQRHGSGPGPEVMGASTLIGDWVVDPHGERVGHIREIMLDLPSGRIAYAVLAYRDEAQAEAAQSRETEGASKLFAVPWAALRLDPQHRRFILDVDRDRLRDAPGFDPQNWPTMAQPVWASRLYQYYGVEPYWD